MLCVVSRPAPLRVHRASPASKARCQAKNSSSESWSAAVNFSSVPTISEQNVTQEPTNQKQQKLTTDPPTLAPYTGATFGRSLGRQAPTVGYQWSLE